MIDLPAVPPPGTSLMRPLPVIASSGGPRNLSGLFITADGRVTIATNGTGLAVRLDAEDAAVLALMLWQVSGHIANSEQEAVSEADAALDRILQERAPHG